MIPKKLTDFTGEVKLGEPGNWSWNEILREGTFINSTTGKDIVVTDETIDNIIKNFNANVRNTNYDGSGKPGVPWDYAHESDKKGAGWIIALEERIHDMPNGSKVASLWAKNDTWSKEAQEAIKDGTWKFASVDYHDYLDVETGKKYKDVLFGVALTNRPAVHGLAPIKLAEKGISQPDKADKTQKPKQNTKGEIQMINKLRAILGNMGVTLSEGSTDEYIVDKAVDRIKYLSEVNAESVKTLAEAKKAKETAETKLSEVEAELKTVKLGEFNRAKAEVEAGMKKAFTPAELADPKHFASVLLAEGKFDVLKGIVEKLGVSFKETKKADEAEDEGEDDENELDPKKEWDDNKSEAKAAAMKKYAEANKFDLSEPKDIKKVEEAVSAKHNEAFRKMASKKGGK